jgi:hypothetical protein
MLCFHCYGEIFEAVYDLSKRGKDYLPFARNNIKAKTATGISASIT